MGCNTSTAAPPVPSDYLSYKLVSELGSGGSATVYLAITGGKKSVAVKRVSLSSPMATREVALQNYLPVHRNVVRCLGSVTDKSSTDLVLELCKTSVHAKMYNAQQPLLPAEAMRVTRETLQGLVALHECGIIHRDLKCENLMLTTDDTVKIADFGLATRRGTAMLGTVTVPAARSKALLGTLNWIAPEVFAGEYGWAVDIWSLGCTVFEMLTGQRPFSSANTAEQLAEQHTVEGVHQLLKRLPLGARAFVGACLMLSASDRPTAAALLNHSWLSDSQSTCTSFSSFSAGGTSSTTTA
eukprot:NODE_566_length_1804_cov_42.220632_g557_i0.p1 GENE.NODE_566_length_1804_cov_42.220632_g557_i0~~NODE_566_length_1804_cov_42.220632_g557_i0.p1  ORF type:complete len:298 (+),score=30.61 NODE_566_length_1804_cov_42.220632_g557_i0:57-950(+)